MIIGRVVVATLAGASVLAVGVEGRALAGPVPVPVPEHVKHVKHEKPAGRVAGAKAHGRSRPAGSVRHRPRTVVRCQSDGTDQVDEIDEDSDEPRHHVTPDDPVPAGTCPGIREALGIADLLGGRSPRRAAPQRASRTARTVR